MKLRLQSQDIQGITTLLVIQVVDLWVFKLKTAYPGPPNIFAIRNDMKFLCEQIAKAAHEAGRRGEPLEIEKGYAIS